MNRAIVARLRELKVHFAARRPLFGRAPAAVVKAVDGVSFELARGEVLGLVGESGCGKSTLGRAILRLIEPTAGQIEIGGHDFLALRGEALRRARPQIQMVFQDPYASLDPRMTVCELVGEPLRAHRAFSRRERDQKALDFLGLVGLAEGAAGKFPHEFSGGQRQRIAIARALVLEPQILVADEPVSSLDVSVQAQILNLLKDVRKQMNLSMIFVSHNLAVVKYISDRIAVMYLGKIVEVASKEDLYLTPRHPYTQMLVSSVPIPDPKLEHGRRRPVISGELPSPRNPPSGCAFHGRCPLVMDRCRKETPTLERIKGGTSHRVACFAVETELTVGNFPPHS